MKNLILNYPTLWNMKKFILMSIFFSILFNGFIVISFRNDLTYFIGFLLLVSYFIFVWYFSEKKQLNDYDIFDKSKIPTYKEYFIYFSITLSYFISIIIIVIHLNSSLEIKNIENIIISSKIDILDYTFKDDKIIYDSIFKQKDERNITKEEINFFNKLNIKDEKKLDKIQNSHIFLRYFNLYILSFILLFVPLTLLATKETYYLFFDLISYYFFILLLGNIHINEMDSYKKHIAYIWDFIFKEHTIITFVIASWFVFFCSLCFFSIRKDNIYAKSYTCYGSIILGLLLYFIIFNFYFELNVFIAFFIMLLIIILLVYPIKQLSVLENISTEKEH